LVVGYLMIEPVLKINFADVTEGLPAFLTLAVMPLTYSIADGMFAGIVSFVLLKLLTGRLREISVTMWVFAALLLLAKILEAVVQYAATARQRRTSEMPDRCGNRRGFWHNICSIKPGAVLRYDHAQRLLHVETCARRLLYGDTHPDLIARTQMMHQS